MNILVTGGASGLGAAISRQLLQGDHTVYFTFANSVEKAHALEQEFPNAKGLQCNFKDPESVNALVEQMPDLDLDVLVNNAISGLQKKHFHKSGPEAFLTGFQQNVLPTIQITSAALTHFRKKKYGKVITILTSYLINKPPIGLSEYVAGKAYLHALSKSWAVENINFNVTSNCISPSIMQTNLTSDTDERIMEEMVKNHPLKKLLSPEEVASSVAYLVEAPQHINGINLVINAGSDLC